MEMIRGITVIHVSMVKVGTDPFNHPVYREVEDPVQNVLVSPTTSDDIITNTDLAGKKAVYTLAIPKGDTHDWTDCKVRFFGQTWKTFGYPIEGIEENIPLAWNKKVSVELYG